MNDDDDDLLRLARAIRDMIRPRLVDSPDLRVAVRALGEWLQTEADRAADAAGDLGRAAAGTRGADAPAATLPIAVEGAPAPPASDPVTTVDAAVSSATTADAAASSAVAVEADAERRVPVAPKAPWTIADLVAATGGPSPATTSRPADAAGTTDSGTAPGIAATSVLTLIATRCRVKAESCRVFIERRAALGDPVREAPLVDRVDALLAQAKALPDCFLWVLYRAREQPADDDLRLIAGAYDALAEAASLCERLESSRPDVGEGVWQHALELCAEATAALRVALRASWLTAADIDQYAAFDWLHRAIAWRGVHLSRYMRRGDEADPARAPEVIEELRALGARVESDRSAPARARAAFRQLEYHATRAIREAPPFAEPHVRRVAELLDAMRRDGLPDTDIRFGRAVPAALLDRVRPYATPPVLAMIDALDRGAPGATRAEADEPEGGADTEPDAPRAWSADVGEVRDRLAGRRVVLIGGEPREEAARRIEEAFGLSELFWVRLTEHGSGEPLRAPILHPETTLVIGVTKLSGHLHLDEARSLARSAGKPFVLLPAGYNPEQIAAAVLAQVSHRIDLDLHAR